jgi:F-type H+-transporting ATPase subunit gamma
MSLLVQLRQRIKATETTKKTTNAMRLTSMATHGRVRVIKAGLESYKREIDRIFDELQHERVTLSGEAHGRELFAVIGSQKGLCGNFNTALVSYFREHYGVTQPPGDIFAIGKQVKDTLLYREFELALWRDVLTITTVPALAEELSSYILSGLYTRVTIYYNNPRSFFAYRPEQVTLTKDQFYIPDQEYGPKNFEGEQPYAETFNALGSLAVRARLQEIFLNSLSAESAARFLSMDAATRNADDLIARLRLDYNKLRQASITREITDLIGSFIS